MSWATSWWISGFMITGVLIFTAREISLYRIDQKSRADIYPYTKERLMRRCMISFCLIAEVLLLLVVRHFLSAARPFWFVGFVTLVIVFAAIMVFLAMFDLKEARELERKSQHRLYQEFLHEIQQDSSSKEIQ